MQSLKSQRVTVAGLGRFGGGIAVARWLAGQGAQVLVTDKDSPEKLADSVQKLDGLKIEFRLGEHRNEDFTAADLVVASPALTLENPYLIAAKNAGVPVTTEIRLFVERCPATIFGVTGSKGKSTTTAMLGKILSSQFKTWVGGNIGGSLLAELEQIGKTDLVVLELSSFMLEHLRQSQWSPHVAVVTMISADHLDWHGTLEAYIDAKRNIVRYQRHDDYAILNGENELCRRLAEQAKGTVAYFGLEGRRPFDLKILGRHNQLNAQAAFAAAEVVGIWWDQAQKALADFTALPHRLQVVGEWGGIQWVNDSIATIPDAAVAALESFPPRKVIQIVGGFDKGLPITALCAALAERAKAVLCIGATGRIISETMWQGASPPLPGAAPVYDCGDLATAVTLAKQIAVAGDVVLLSPGFASYDQFINFERRGETFAKLASQAMAATTSDG